MKDLPEAEVQDYKTVCRKLLNSLGNQMFEWLTFQDNGAVEYILSFQREEGLVIILPNFFCLISN